MSRRLPFEELAMRRTKRRSARIRKLIEDIAYDWYDEIDMISELANDLGAELDHFDKQAAEIFEEIMRQRREGDDLC